MQGVNSTGVFTLILSYISTSRVSAVISVGSKSGVVSLKSCPEHCYENLTVVLGEMSLTGSVVVNVTYDVSIVGFSPVDVVALPQEFYQTTLLRNSTRQDFLANCSVIENDMGIGTDQEEFCLVQVFSLTVNYLGRALCMFSLFVYIFCIYCWFYSSLNKAHHHVFSGYSLGDQHLYVVSLHSNDQTIQCYVEGDQQVVRLNGHLQNHSVHHCQPRYILLIGIY